jgi:D-alanyl-D-alanine endopeptidase (penicillin-binding protein 7)
MYTFQELRWLWLLPVLAFHFTAVASPTAEQKQNVQGKVVTTQNPPANKSTSQRKPAASVDLTKPDVRSHAVLVFDEADGSVVYARRADEVLPIASITKLMTALVVLDGHQPLDEVLEITRDDRDTEHGSTSRLPIGTKLTRGELLHLALMSSENRAAHALGRNYPGGVKSFVRTMNIKAESLGMTQTTFADPTGLSNRNRSTARDLAKLVIAASRDPDIRRFSTDERYTVKVGKQLIEFRNTNSLVSKPDWDISVQKTGYTAEAGRCLVMKSMIQDRPVVMVLLNSFGKYTRVADASRIRRWLEATAPTRLADVHRLTRSTNEPLDP